MIPRRWILAVAVSCSAFSGCNLLGDDDEDNSPPQLTDQRFSGLEDSLLSAQIVATDPGDTLTFAIVESPSHGTLAQFSSSGAFHYEPDENFTGTDSFVARVADSAQQSVRAQILLEITPVNDAPAPAADVFTVSVTTSLAVLANDTDPDGDALTLDSVDPPLVGSAYARADGTVRLDLPAEFNGVTRFRYRVRDSTGLTADALAVVFVGIGPLKVVYLGTDGIYVDDFTTTYRASAAEGSPTRIMSMAVSTSGRALAYFTQEAGGASPTRVAVIAARGIGAAALSASNSSNDVCMPPAPGWTSSNAT